MQPNHFVTIAFTAKGPKQVYAGPDAQTAQSAYSAEAHAYYAEQVATMRDGKQVGQTTVSSTHK